MEKRFSKVDNMTPIPKPTLQQAIDGISDRDEYKVIVTFIREERERCFGDLKSADSSNDVMRIAGSISALDELLGLLG
jgi:hypothetical protein